MTHAKIDMDIIIPKQEEHDHANYVFNYNQITDNIYIGNNMCCMAMLDELLLKEGIYADLSLEEELHDNPVGASCFLWVPIVDHTGPTIENINITNAYIDSVVKMGEKIYIHCKNGHGRAPTIVIAYMISKGMSYDQAYNLVKSKRSVIHLDTTQETFLNNIKS